MTRRPNHSRWLLQPRTRPSGILAGHALMVLFLLASGCGGGKRRPAVTPVPSRPAPETTRHPVPLPPAATRRAGFTIQAGAFRNEENAARLTAILNAKGLDAYYFLYRTGLFKVRFGDWKSQEEARREALRCKKEGLIADFYIVTPGSYTVAQRDGKGLAYLRERLVATARSYLGTSYQWGGTSESEGFDCSGLVMTVYRLNGMVLPRSSAEQFQTGTEASQTSLQPGDLVFFATGRGNRISHVGIYTGDGQFIHAPGPGRKIRTDSLNSSYFTERFMGGRCYLR